MNIKRDTRVQNNIKYSIRFIWAQLLPILPFVCIQAYHKLLEHDRTTQFLNRGSREILAINLSVVLYLKLIVTASYCVERSSSKYNTPDR